MYGKSFSEPAYRERACGDEQVQDYREDNPEVRHHCWQQEWLDGTAEQEDGYLRSPSAPVR